MANQDNIIIGLANFDDLSASDYTCSSTSFEAVDNTSVVTHMLPEMSIQKTTRESSTLMEPPVAPPTADTGAGEMMNVVSDLEGISSGIMSTSFLVPQNSHTHT